MDTHPIRLLKNLGRSREIATVLLNFGFGDLVDRLRLRRYLQWGRRLLRRKGTHLDPPPTRAARLRMALEHLGPTYVKFGQLLSTRADLVPADVIDELSKLQEKVPPFGTEEAIETLESELGRSLDQLFDEFDRTSVAAGSLAQVHRARLHDGRTVAVKILRPGIVAAVERDLSLMLELANLLERHIPESRVFDPVGLVQHFSRTIRREMNLVREARTMRDFTRMFRSDATLHVPQTVDELCSQSVIVMEFIEGFRSTDIERLMDAGITPSEVAANGARLFIKQAFELGVFHGDPHPGNLRILADGSICLLDYGMVGMLEEADRERLVDLMLAVHRGDVAAACELVVSIGEPFLEIDLPLFRADIRDFIHSYYGVELEMLNVSRMLCDVLSIVSHHGIRIPGDVLMLIRALVTLEGTGHNLDPKFNMSDHLAPIMKSLVRRRLNPRHIARRLMADSRLYLQLAHDFPLHLGRSIEKLSRNELRIQLEHRSMDHLISELDRSSNRLAIGLVVSALLLASALVIRASSEMWWLAAGIFLASSLLGIWLIYGVFRSGRL